MIKGKLDGEREHGGRHLGNLCATQRSSTFHHTSLDRRPISSRIQSSSRCKPADLYAGQLNRVMASDRIAIPPSPALRTLWPISGYHRVLDYKYLAPLRDHFMRMAKKVEDETPGTLK